MDLSGFLKGDIDRLEDQILRSFNESLVKISCFDMGYKVFKFFGKNIELYAYKKSKKDFIFYTDEYGVENHISVYSSFDKKDLKKGTCIEFIIGEKKKKELIFLSEYSIYNIVENKRSKILESNIIKDESKIYSILSFLLDDIHYLSNKVKKSQNKLRQKGLLNKEVTKSQIEKFQINFNQNILELA